MSKLKPFNLEEAKAGAKVVTRDGRPVKIICWDMKSGERNDIVALIPTLHNNTCIGVYYTNGKLISDSAHVGNKDLFILEPEPELTEFENRLAEIIYYARTHKQEASDTEIIEDAKKLSTELLAIARKELRLEVEAEYWGTQKPYFKGKEDGRAELLKDLPKWRKFKDICEFFTEEKDCITTEPIIVKGLINDDDYRIIQKGVMVNDELYAIKISDLKRLSKEE